MNLQRQRLRVVIVNYNGGALLERAVESALASAWHGDIDVVVVDNGSSDGSLEIIDGRDGVSIIRNVENLGFGANNQAIADLVGGEIEGLDPPEAGGTVVFAPADLVVLLNPDAMVRPDTFTRLAAALDPGRRIGSAAPTIVFDRPFVELPVTGGEVTIDQVTIGNDDVTAQCHRMGEAYRLPGRERPVWRCPDGTGLRVPVARLGEQIEVRTDRTSSGLLAGHAVGGRQVIDLASHALPTVAVVQNAGAYLDNLGYGINRGYGDVAGSRSYAPLVPAWCGACSMLHADYLADVGGFEESYFLYYEDIDLSMRGLARGWSTVHVADAIVEHRHSDRTRQGTKLVEVLQHRNRLLMLVRHAPWRRVGIAWLRAALTPLSIMATAIRQPSHARPLLRLAWWRVSSLAAAFRMFGSAVSGRREVNEHRRLPARRVLGEATGSR